MSKNPNYDAKVKKILDELTPGPCTCELTGEKWEMTDEEIGWYKKFNVPPHPWAPLVRLKYMTGFPSGISIWKKPHAKTGEPILSFIHPDSPYKVITDKEWFSNEFQQTERELNPSESFFDQFRNLAHSIPVGALRDDGSSVNTVGVDLIDCQDSYMIFGGLGLQRVMYAAISYNEQDSCLLTNTKSASDSFMINASAGLHGCRYCIQNGKLVNCTFCFASDNLENCYGASNQSYKKYLFWNEQLSKEEWEKRVSEIDLSNKEVWDQQVARFHKMLTREAYWYYRFEKEPNPDCTGEYLMNSTRCNECYWVDDGLDLFQCWMAFWQRESFSCVWTGWGDRFYQAVDIAYGSNIKFCCRVWRSQNMEYCYDCYDSEFCFGCAGLFKKKFHIYNKPYSEDEYWKKVDEIKSSMLDRGEYGMFFPADFSQPGFQFSMGQFFLSYSPEELKQFNAPVFDSKVGNMVSAGNVIKASELPNRLDDIDPEKHIGKPILDERLGRMFIITPKEFEFYKKHGLPVPREHFLTRMTNLFRHSNTPIPEKEVCAMCKKDIVTYKNALFSGKRRVICRKCQLEFLETR